MRGYPIHSNVKRRGVHPTSPSASEGEFIFDASVIERGVVKGGLRAGCKDAVGKSLRVEKAASASGFLGASRAARIAS